MILIVGAGPTGLVLALWLAKSGVDVRIIDKLAEPGTTSRALVLHARTMEFYRQLGIADDVVERSLPFGAVNLWVQGEKVAHIELGAMGEGVTPYPTVLIFPQDQHERFLIHELASLGVTVERPLELVTYNDTGGDVEAELRDANSSIETVRASFIVGCDGASSVVRKNIGAEFPGGTYSHLFYVADVVAHGAMTNKELHVAIDEADFIAAFPLKEESAIRLIGTIADAAVDAGRPLGWDDVSSGIIERMKLNVVRVNWFSTYHVHHRVASSWQRGHAFIAGDAAHIHSPVGGQGMNTGIGDAVNLAWKLAEVVHGRAHVSLLQTYEPERIAFARRLVESTDRAFEFVSSDGRLARFVRTIVAPTVLPMISRSTFVRSFAFRTVSQTNINYHDSALSSGHAGDVRGGDRLPWVAQAAAEADNFAPLTSRQWQVHVYGAASDEISQRCNAQELPLHVFEYSDGAKQAGFARDAAYVVRPDGYVAVAGATGEDIDALKSRSSA